MASYTVLSSQSTIQVLSSTLTVDAFQSTIQTSPSNVIAQLTLAQTYFDDGSAPDYLATYANNIETLMASGKVIAGTGVQTLDANELLQDAVDFTVAYTPPGSTTGPLTVQVTIPNSLIALVQLGLGGAQAMIDDAYNQLIVLSGGTPPAAPSSPPPPPLP